MVKLNTVRLMRRWGIGWLALALVVVPLLGCDRGATAETPQTKPKAVTSGGVHVEKPSEADSRTAAAEEEGLQLGEYRLARDPVVDGDTIRVEGIEKSIRLLSLDTEERFHGKAERAGVPPH